MLDTLGDGFNPKTRGGHIRYKANDDPEESDGPADCVVAPHTVPVENQGQGETLTENKSGEQDEDKGCDVVEELEEEDGADDFERREFSQGACARWFPPTGRHPFVSGDGGSC